MQELAFPEVYQIGARRLRLKRAAQAQAAFWTRDRTGMTMGTEDWSSFTSEGKQSHA